MEGFQEGEDNERILNSHQGEGVPRRSPLGWWHSIWVPFKVGDSDLQWTRSAPWSGFLQQHSAALQALRKLHRVCPGVGSPDRCEKAEEDEGLDHRQS